MDKLKVTRFRRIVIISLIRDLELIIVDIITDFNLIEWKHLNRVIEIIILKLKLD